VGDGVLLDFLFKQILHDDLILPTQGGKYEGSKLSEVAELHSLTATQVLLIDEHLVIKLVGGLVLEVPNLLHFEQTFKRVFICIRNLDLQVLVAAEFLVELLPGEGVGLITHIIMEHTEWLCIPGLVPMLVIVLVHAKLSEVYSQLGLQFVFYGLVERVKDQGDLGFALYAVVLVESVLLELQLLFG